MASSVSSNTRPELPAMSKSDADLKRYLETTNATPTCSTQLQQPSFHPDNAHLPAFTLYGLQHTANQSPPLPDKPASIYDSQHNYDSHRMDIKQEPAAASTWNQPQPVLYTSSPTLPHHVPVINNQGHYNSEVVLLPRHAPQNGAADVSISYVTFPPYGIDAFDKHPPTAVTQDQVRFPLYEEGRAPVSYLDTTNPSSTPSSIRAGLDTPPPSSLSHESSTPASVFSTISVSPPGQRVLTPPVAPDAPHSSLAMDEAVLKDSDMTDCSPFLFGTSEHMPSQEYGLNTLDHPADSIMYQYSSDFGIGDHFSGMSYDYQQFDSSTAFADNENEVPFPASGSILDPPHTDAEPPRHTGRGRGRGRGRGGRRGSARKSQAGDDASDKLRKKRSQQHVGTSHHDDHYALSDRDSKRPRTQSDAVPRLTPYRLRASSLTNQSTSIGFHHVADPSDDDDSDEPDAREGGDEAGGDSDYEDPEDDSDPEEDDEQIDDDGDDEYIQGRSSARSRPRGSLNRKGRKGRAKSHLSAAWALKTVQAESDEPTVSSQILEYTDDMDVDAPSMYQRNGKTRRKRTSMIPLPVPVPNLTKKSRGRKVPQEPLDGTEDMVGESSSSGYVCSGEGSGQRSSRGRRVPTITDGPGLEDRPFVCEVDGCGKRFVRGEHLKRHVRSIHTHDKPFICPYKGCGKTFSRRDNLGQHARVHVS